MFRVVCITLQFMIFVLPGIPIGSSLGKKTAMDMVYIRNALQKKNVPKYDMVFSFFNFLFFWRELNVVGTT